MYICTVCAHEETAKLLTIRPLHETVQQQRSQSTISNILFSPSPNITALIWKVSDVTRRPTQPGGWAHIRLKWRYRSDHFCKSINLKSQTLSLALSAHLGGGEGKKKKKKIEKKKENDSVWMGPLVGQLAGVGSGNRKFAEVYQPKRHAYRHHWLLPGH